MFGRVSFNKSFFFIGRKVLSGTEGYVHFAARTYKASLGRWGYRSRGGKVSHSHRVKGTRHWPGASIAKWPTAGTLAWKRHTTNRGANFIGRLAGKRHFTYRGAPFMELQREHVSGSPSVLFRENFTVLPAWSHHGDDRGLTATSQTRHTGINTPLKRCFSTIVCCLGYGLVRVFPF